jgi:hypothetical protein
MPKNPYKQVADALDPPKPKPKPAAKAQPKPKKPKGTPGVLTKGKVQSGTAQTRSGAVRGHAKARGF